MFLGSDALAVAPFTNRVVYLEEGDCCVLSHTSYTIFDEAGVEVRRPETIVQAAGATVEKGNYRHFMQKEIFEQPTVRPARLAPTLTRSNKRWNCLETTTQSIGVKSRIFTWSPAGPPIMPHVLPSIGLSSLPICR